MKKAIIYYTCNTHRPEIEEACRRRILDGKGDAELVTVSLQPIDYGDSRAVLSLPRSPETMFKQIDVGLRMTNADVVFLCESDVYYDPSHFEFEPSREDTFYYNTNVWRVRYDDAFAVRTDFCQQLSGLCVYRKTLLAHMRERMEKIAAEGFSRKMGYEPFTHDRVKWPTQFWADSWESEAPNVDIRHDANITASRWSPFDFRNRKYAKGWREDAILFRSLINSIKNQ